MALVRVFLQAVVPLGEYENQRIELGEERTVADEEATEFRAQLYQRIQKELDEAVQTVKNKGKPRSRHAGMNVISADGE